MINYRVSSMGGGGGGGGGGESGNCADHNYTVFNFSKLLLFLLPTELCELICEEQQQ